MKYKLSSVFVYDFLIKSEETSFFNALNFFSSMKFNEVNNLIQNAKEQIKCKRT